MIDTISTTISIEQIKEESNRIHALNIEVGKVIVGNRDIIDFIIIALLCDGHILLEGVPGVAKTTMIKTMALALGLHFNRIQFTPDLLPADVVGTLIYNQKTQEFETKKGPIFANLVLADEINRTPAKVQSALLEAMQERQITIGGQTFKLDHPFLVFATQNPLEQEGTYRLPEAQVDRFMFKLLVDYPNEAQEREIVLRSKQPQSTQRVVSLEDIEQARRVVSSIYVDDKIIDYIINIVFATRNPVKARLQDLKHYIQYGVSPRATTAVYKAACAYAFVRGKRNFVIPDDVKAVVPAIFRHRLTLTAEAEIDGITPDQIIQKILDNIPTP